jgi:hypothetical protein
MTTQHDHTEPLAGVPEAGEERAYVSRRRFTRAGLTSTVVLGSLASKPVLGAAPYHCTVSGQASGTLSRQGVMDVCRKGDSIATWRDANAARWLAVDVIKGSAWTNGCEYPGAEQTEFNGFRLTPGGVSLAHTFWGRSGGGTTCTMVTTSTNKPASMYQVLASTSTDPTIELGRMVVVSLLNAIELKPNYGATPEQVIEMFNAVRSGGTYSVAGRIWSRADVVGYLALLLKA